MKNSFLLTLIFIFFLVSCMENSKQISQVHVVQDWKSILNEQISLLGHRNWILIVDKAFPLQNGSGIITIDTNEDLLSVLNYTLQQIDNSIHVKPIIYTDTELRFLTKDQIPDIEIYKASLAEIIDFSSSQELFHDSVFVKIDEASGYFKVLVLKTNGTIPYSSVFLQLDCKYWSAENEKQLRDKIRSEYNEE